MTPNDITHDVGQLSWYTLPVERKYQTIAFEPLDISLVCTEGSQRSVTFSGVALLIEGNSVWIAEINRFGVNLHDAHWYDGLTGARRSPSGIGLRVIDEDVPRLRAFCEALRRQSRAA